MAASSLGVFPAYPISSAGTGLAASEDNGLTQRVQDLMTVLQNSPQHEPFSGSAYGAGGYSAWLAAAVQARAESNELRDNI